MNILLVENHAVFATQVTGAFLGEHQVVVVPTISGARAEVDARHYDAVLVDYDLDDGKGEELVRWLRTRGEQQLVVAISSHDAGNRAMVAAGADAVCGKMEFSRIKTVIEAMPNKAGAGDGGPKLAQNGGRRA